MPSAAAEETFLVVASTDLERAPIMMSRIREQLGKVSELNTMGQIEVSAMVVPMPDRAAVHSLQDQVQEVAASVSEMVQTVLGGNQTCENF
jgi:hypothetical protein